MSCWDGFQQGLKEFNIKEIQKHKYYSAKL